MTLRQKFALAFASVAGVVTITIGLVTYSTTQRAVQNEIDVSLAAAVNSLAAGGSLTTAVDDSPGGDGRGRGGRDGGPQTVIETAQSVTAGGVATHLSGDSVVLPVSARALQVARSSSAGQRTIDEVRAGDFTYRVITQSLGAGKGAIQVGRDLDEATRVLSRLAWVTILVGAGVLLLAAGAGWVLARRLTRRLSRLTDRAEQVSRDGALDVDFGGPDKDEVGRLSGSLQLMVNRLSASRQAQQRLVQNAGHELRTPLTSLRTNVTVLQRFSELSESSRQRLLDDLTGETLELTNLVNELMELALEQDTAEPTEPVDIISLTRGVIARHAVRTGRMILLHGPDRLVVSGQPKALARAVSNLIDNALKFDPSASEIEVDAAAAGVAVSDRGPGVAPEDVALVFDRFYRSDAARSLPGSGLGLAIVADVAASHGGRAFTEPRIGGGARIGFTIGSDRLLPDSKPHPVLG